AVGRIRELWTSQPRAPRTPVLVAALSALVVVALVAARLPGAKRPDALERPNVLLIGVDSLRADHFDPSHMPELSRFIEHGTRFDRAYVSLPRTFPSWTTLL